MATEFELDDPGRIDVDSVRAFLSTRAYRARWRTRADGGAPARRVVAW
ncbi:MAG TPA: hypothetical protein VGX25_15975 [Actinophytocola sp.]|nr:hypothetical protein [Actinophytocola sp.]HEV2780883.1 hypothetical protein [Actinophytocola sp.]